MKTTTRVVVIGGGVVGCSVLYHLTKMGWSDVMLLERSELTAGSTWHAAGGFHTINGDTNMAALQGYTIKLYRELEEITGLSCGLHHTGGITMADTRDRFDQLLAERAKHRHMGLNTHIVTPDEIRDIAPITNTDGIIGALYDPLDGHLDPAGTTHAYARAARMAGATIETHCKVKETNPRPDGSWEVVTDKGTIHAEHVVNAAGLWAREVAAMAGHYVPLHPMEHHYLITDDIPEIYERDTEHPHVVDPGGESYLRQEGRGICIGYYEKKPRPWAVDGTPWDFGSELLPDDLDKISDSIEFSYKRFPVLATAGVKRVIHGPFTFAPDGNPLIGPIRGLPGMWSACGVMAGFSQGGGVGLALANWITQGDPGFDVWAMDIARYGDWATMSYTNPKVQENYSRRFSIKFPNEELQAARPYKTTPIYDRMLSLGAQMGDSWGLEAPLWFSPDGTRDEFSWRRSTDFSHVKEEVRATREDVGVMEISGFSKFYVRGSGATAFLDTVLACKLPKPGRMTLAPMLKENGKLQGDLTVACLSETEYYLAGSGMAEVFYARWFEKHMPQDGSVSLEVVGLGLVGLSIAGPKSRELLQRLTPADMSNGAFRFMDIRQIDVGFAPCLVGRVSFTGDLGYEIWMKPEYQRHVFDRLLETGKDLGLKPFGLRALNAMRLEKNFGGWAREFRPVYGPLEAGLDRFIAYEKETDFIGKSAALAERGSGGELRLRAFTVAAIDADVIGDEPIWHDGNVVGWVTSGGYAHNAGQSVAMGYVAKDVADSEGPWAIELLGEMLEAKPQHAPLFDANFERMRG